MSLSSDQVSSGQGDGAPEVIDMLINMSSPSNYIQDDPIQGCNSQAPQEMEDDSQQYDPRSLPIVVSDPETLEQSIKELCRFALQQDVAEEPLAQPLSDDATPVVESTDNLQLGELITPPPPSTNQESIQEAKPNESQPQLYLQDATDSTLQQANMRCDLGLPHYISNTQNEENQAYSQESSLQVVTQNNRMGNIQPADNQETSAVNNVLANNNLILQTIGPLHLVNYLIPTEVTPNITPRTGNILNDAQTYIILDNLQQTLHVQLSCSSPPVIHIPDEPLPSQTINEIISNNPESETPVTINLVEDVEIVDAIAESGDYSNVDQYIQAVSSLSAPNTHECFLCDFIGKSENSFRNHIAYRHPNKRQVLKCKHCPYVTAFKDYMSHHKREQHNNSETHHRCSSPCSFKTKRKRSLKKHMRCEHQEAQYYNCSGCAFKSKYKENATKHQRYIHDKTFLLLNCYFCDFSTGYGCSMRRHVRSLHKIQEPKVYGCSECEFRSGYKREMLYHVRATHPKQPEHFKCKRCDFSSTSKSDVKQHTQSKHKHNERALQCKICHCETRSLDSLRKHIKNKHAVLLKHH